MTKALVKNTFREIKNTKARFFSIMAIIALGVGFFAGIKSTAPSMYNMAEQYYKDCRLMDYRLVSTVGFDKNDISAVKSLDGVQNVMPSYGCDVVTNATKGGEVVHLIANPTAWENNELLNKLKITDGRLPHKSGEIAVEASGFGSKKYKTGDKVVFSENTGESKTKDRIKKLEYTVVGLVNSPLYISYQRGESNEGSGKVSQYMYICPCDFNSQRYTELYVKADFSEKFSSFSDEYDDAVSTMSGTLKNTAQKRCSVFTSDVIDKSKNDLIKSKNKLDSEKQSVKDKLDKAKKSLDDAKKDYKTKISEAEKKLNSAKTEIENAKSELKSAKSTYYTAISNAEGTIALQESKLGDAQKQYNSSCAEYDAKIASAQKKLDSGKQKYEAEYTKFKKEQEPQLTLGISKAEAAVGLLEQKIESEADEQTREVLKMQLAQAQQTLDKLKTQYENAKLQFEQTKSSLDKAQKEFDAQKNTGKNELKKADAQIQSAKEKLQNAKISLQTKKDESSQKFTDAQKKIDDAQMQYESSTAELKKQKTSGQSKLDSAEKEYNLQKAEAEKKLDNAQKKIDDAQQKIDSIASPKWYVFDRTANPGYSTFSQNADRLDAVASVFPMFFLLVAVLVCVTTMTRLIEEKRTETGTLKALGYSNVSITAKYVAYSLIAAVTGSVLGIALGISTLPFIIYNAYKIMYYMGDITLVPNVASIVISVLAAVVCTASVSVVVCLRSLHSRPAAIMRPKAPKPGKRILIEYITPVWKHLNFTKKFTARNLFRYKSRLCMTVLGVAGCTALIVAAFGLLNSFDPLTNDQFNTIYKYNTVVAPKESGTAQNLKYLTDEIGKDKNVKDAMLVMQQDATAKHNNNSKNSGINLIVPQSPDSMGSMISLHTRNGKTEFALSDNSVLINEKLAKELGVKSGDTFSLTANSKTAEVKVGGVYEQYINNYVYISPKLYSSLYSSNIKYNLMFARLDDTSQQAQDNFGTAHLQNTKIATVSYVKSSIKDFKNMLNSLNMVVLVMIVCAAALAFVVLYNLSNINIAERVREIATFKVLGFNNRETSSFIYRENIVLTVLGIALGLVLGVFLTAFIVQTVEVDNIMFGRTIYFTSYLYAAALTLVFSLLVNAVMSFKIKAVNMVESLKSIE